MSETILKAVERIEDLKKVRAAGFTPGVLYGPGTKSTSVKFETKALNKVITSHGKNAKVWIELGAEKQFGFIKDIQRHPVEGNIIHTVVHLVAVDKEVKMQLPIAFHGTAQLEHNLLHVQVYKAEIEVLGAADKMPDAVIADVSEKKLGENITAIDFHLPAGMIILDAKHEIYAVIKAKQEMAVDESKEVKVAV